MPATPHLASSHEPKTTLGSSRKIGVTLFQRRISGVRILTERARNEKYFRGKRWKMLQTDPSLLGFQSVYDLLGRLPFMLSRDQVAIREFLAHPMQEQLPMEDAVRKGFLYTETTWVNVELLDDVPALDHSDILCWQSPTEIPGNSQPFRRKDNTHILTSFGHL